MSACVCYKKSVRVWSDIRKAGDMDGRQGWRKWEGEETLLIFKQKRKNDNDRNLKKKERYIERQINRNRGDRNAEKKWVSVRDSDIDSERKCEGMRENGREGVWSEKLMWLVIFLI